MTARTAISPHTGTAGQLVMEETVLGKYLASYYFDQTAKTIFVDQPTWLEEAYSDAIALTDTGILHRNLQNIRDSADIILDFSDDPGRIRGVDLGAGYGLFVRGMRDKGFSFYWSDLYAENLVARGFDAAPGAYDVAVAFEVLEHLENPIAFLRENKDTYGFRYLIFSATCFDPDQLPDKDWWYWSFESGQHISFFSREGLAYIAEQLGMRVRHITNDIFLMQDLDQPPFISVHDRGRLQRLAGKFTRARRKREKRMPKSLIWDDHFAARDKLRAQSPGK